jgi:hypothetical protein
VIDMAMSDCIKCWETPCSCGFEYSKEYKYRQSYESRKNLVLAIVRNMDNDEKVKIFEELKQIRPFDQTR